MFNSNILIINSKVSPKTGRKYIQKSRAEQMFFAMPDGIYMAQPNIVRRKAEQMFFCDAGRYIYGAAKYCPS